MPTKPRIIPMPEFCPRCGSPYDPATDQILTCRICGRESSTACCHTAGAGCPCDDCGEAEKLAWTL